MYLIWVLLLLPKPGDYISLVLLTITKDDSSSASSVAQSLCVCRKSKKGSKPP